MKRFIYISVLLVFVASLAFLQTKGVAQTPAAAAANRVNQSRELIETYCVDCHSTTLKTGGLALDKLDLNTAADHADVWEKVIRKLRGRLMPPPGNPQPQ